MKSEIEYFFQKVRTVSPGRIFLGERVTDDLIVESENESKTREVEDAAVAARLLKLVEAARARSSLALRYMCELAVRPVTVTRKEFRRLYAIWTTDRRAQVLDQWIAGLSVERAASVDDVEEELFETILQKRNQVLSSAAELESREEHKLRLEEADMLLDMIGQFLLGSGRLTGERFRKLYDQTGYWIGFRKNQSDEVLRIREEAMLLKLLASASDALSIQILEAMPHGWHPDMDVGGGKEVGELKRALREKCMALVMPKAAKEAITFIARDGGVQSLTEDGRFSGVRYCLFTPDSPVWTTALREELIELVRKGQQEPAIYGNIRVLLSLLVLALGGRVNSISRRDALNVISDQDFMRCLWETVMSKDFQYRMQMTIIQDRQALIDNGVPERVLPLTQELRARLEEDLQSRAQSTPSPSNIQGIAPIEVEPLAPPTESE